MSKESPYGHKATDEMLSNAGLRRTTVVKPLEFQLKATLRNVKAEDYSEAERIAHALIVKKYGDTFVSVKGSAWKQCNGAYTVDFILN
ncbi:hypothetical protein [Xanthomonas phage XAJ2]|uniref:Uncharacterized protein n=1 Tax=Xanthomonas phage XAJ2 TaxID=1775249 RepID=A0A1I9L2J8_9CAUD|nr:hypothetical protein [Xanthomonas phage XAJ2]